MKKVLVGIIIVLLGIGGYLFIKKPFVSNEVDSNLDSKVDKSDDVLDDNVVGIWDTDRAVNSNDGTETDNLRDIFGSSYSEYGSYIEFKDDGTFVDRIQPITNGSRADSGTYKVEKDYNKPGDCYVFLTYSDGSEGKLQRVILDDSSIYYLVLEEFVNEYQLILKKR